MNIRTSIMILLYATAVSLLAMSSAANAGQPLDHAAQELSEPGIRITYLLFSGRENPKLTIPAGEMRDHITVRLDRAKDSATRMPDSAYHPILGYNGILVEVVDEAGKLTSSQVVKGEVLRVDSPTGRAPDALRSWHASELEQLLVSAGQSSGALDAELAALILDGSR